MILVTALIATVDIGLVETELGRYHLGPPSLEVVLRDISHAKDIGLVLEGEVFVFLAEASSAGVTELHEVGDKLGNLV